IFFHALLDGTDFREARLHHAVLIGARGTGTIFSKADLSEIYAPKVSLVRAQFNEAKLEAAHLVSADLRGSNFTQAMLAHANLQEANLREASLARADLTGAQLDAAELQKAGLQGANLALVTGLTQAQLDTACVDEQTKLPEGLSRPGPCAGIKAKKK
ncbi:MAG TPA: pentapeptide repeat-containing protein, partial [Terriglobales bacterium]|nr:pentapeptide repeat-containing protein [Terriglobales bacterium]